MSTLDNKKWSTGSGNALTLQEVLRKISDHLKNKDKKIFIGSDSHMTKKKVCFVTTVCLLSDRKGGKYFFYKENEAYNAFSALPVRITEEVRRSIELAEYITKNYDVSSNSIELHLDVSPLSAKNGTSKLSEMLKGYVQGYGFGCVLKPDAWASQSVADRHSK